MTYENNPLELGFERLIAWDLPEDVCLSIAALKRIRDEGVSRRINGVELDGEPFPALNNVKWPVTIDGARVGKVTSAIHSPRLGKNIGYAWLPADRSTEGRSVTVDTEWGTRTGTVVRMPFVDPEKSIPVS
jgi:aminomethyltransferase